MTFLIRARNVNDAYPAGVQLLRTTGIVRPSRYGETIELDEPVVTHYDHPHERVLFDPIRDANPFFHLFEALWILAGRNDVAFLTRFNKRMAEFSDDGTTFHAPYGARLRSESKDQLAIAIRMLRQDPSSRRVVCSIWDPVRDLDAVSKDIPCNDTIKFEARDGRLNMTVFCRSNDIVWGCYGANAVQFSMIQQYVAECVGLPIGWYEQVSCNFHAYTGVWEGKCGPWTDQYSVGRAVVRGLLSTGVAPEAWDFDCAAFLDHVEDGDLVAWPYAHSFFPLVALPMARAWESYKAGTYAGELSTSSIDWHVAGHAWIERRAHR